MEIVHQKENKRFVLPLENGLEAFVSYRQEGNTLKLIYSEVPNDMRGKGIGKELVLQTFEKLTREGFKAEAVCSYIKSIAARNPEWSKIIL